MSGFNQSKYNYQWQKKNMLSISLRYNKEFVIEFRNALDELDLKQSDVFRKTMQDTIDKAKEARSKKIKKEKEIQ